MRLITALLAALLLALSLASASPARAETLDADPRRLERLGEAALSERDKETARTHFEAMLAASEIKQYLPYRDYLGEALVLERLEDHSAAAEKYRFGIQDDALRAVQVLRILSEHPQREALVQEAYAHIRGLAAAAAAGEDALIYTTSKGAPRYLKPMDTAEVLAASERGERLNYCYVPSLDLSGVANLPEKIHLNRCVVGEVRVADQDVGRLYISGFILGDADLGKVWEGERHKSRTLAASRFEELFFRDAVFMGRANFAGVRVSGARAYFPMAVFEGEADFKGAEFEGVTEFRFASFGAGADFRNLRMHGAVYFVSTRFRDDVVFTQVQSDDDVYFPSATFEGEARFDRCEWQESATFEDSRFLGPALFEGTRLRKRLNLSRAVFHAPLMVNSVQAQELDVLGAWFQESVSFVDSNFEGRVRFSPDAVTRVQGLKDLDSLLPLYRDYQGDQDAEEPLTRVASYGVEDVDDLITRVDADLNFDNTHFGGFTVFERIHFGGDGGRHVASFYNAQFLGETHFEDTTWSAVADFSTIFGAEVAFNRATFEQALILDDAYVRGRVTLTDAAFADSAYWSWYGAEILNFQVYPEHVDHPDGGHRLFYERCALGEIDPTDLRIQRLSLDGVSNPDDVRQVCYDYLIDEFVGLKEHYADEAMTEDEDDAYWWERHHETMSRLHAGGTVNTFRAVIRLLLFELCFGWGVRLGNLGICTLVVTALFAWIYRVFCPDTVLSYDGEDVLVRDVSYVGLFFVSLQSMLAINTGWDFGDDDHRFRYLNTIQTLIGVIILTFFVGAYTRMILA